ncbi:hypothetical protein METH_00300 [Leisingera methylohalidivorans DSM 14336]|uniref:Uncharacterized protein n=1 Tax=Leisingera methylohalidivorans DSM 14336 TaxID=999552 RepID=V9VYL2_9RHOB|nr:hypothetical protein METH_00300 [Leisingera methylohalidivorans DSM 14336]
MAALIDLRPHQNLWLQHQANLLSGLPQRACLGAFPPLASAAWQVPIPGIRNIRRAIAQDDQPIPAQKQGQFHTRKIIAR